MRALFRVDSGRKIGGGHLFRCLVLADELAHRGASCAFACRPHEGALLDAVKARGHDVHALSHARDVSCGVEADHGGWIGARPEEDAAETVELLERVRADWLVVDHYGLDARWEQSVRKRFDVRALVIDDLADRPHDCEVLLDQNLWPDAAERYDGLVPAQCRRLLGPRYALLRGSGRARCAPLPPCGTALAFFGAEDPTGECRKLVSAWLALYGDRADAPVRLRVVAGLLNRDRAWLEEQAAGSRGLSITGWVDDLPDELARVRCAIGAAGGTTWERLAAGCESWVVAVAEHQRALAMHLVELGVAHRVGTQAATAPEDYVRCLRE
ncbi:MAG: UDP-2,4-diacetamido-2,4,6-trideoxy-beta-L-altropyranose hydrolase, partial [Pseudomonadales bacterium]|nr:UDP-2,4-diacetamido-2,4,6-trideoxy-beta-L-altropyranose hydrolase [Pseudomonadales bacterium]